jgi:hypothetical protein
MKKIVLAILVACFAVPALAEQPKEIGVTYTAGKPGTQAPAPVVSGNGTPVATPVSGGVLTFDGRGTSSAGDGGSGK